MTELIVSICLIIAVVLLVHGFYGCNPLPKILSTRSRMKTKNDQIHKHLLRTPSQRTIDRFGSYSGEYPFFYNLTEDVMDSLIAYWGTSHTSIDYINANGIIVMSDGTLVYPDGTIAPTYLQHGDEEQTYPGYAAAEEVLGGNHIRLEDGAVMPTMLGAPAREYPPMAVEERFEHPIHSVPEPPPVPSHHDYTPHTPSSSPVHYDSPSDSSPSYSSPSDSSPSYSE